MNKLSKLDKKKVIKYLFLAGKIGCIVLYILGLNRGIKKKKWGLFGFIALIHISETFIIGIKTGVENGNDKIKSAICTLLFGFTWWLPIKMGWNK